MKYTDEEVRDYADACRLAHRGPVIADMLTAYADILERIKAAQSEDCRIGFFEGLARAAREKGYADIAEAIYAAPTAPSPGESA